MSEIPKPDLLAEKVEIETEVTADLHHYLARPQERGPDGLPVDAAARHFEGRMNRGLEEYFDPSKAIGRLGTASA